ncbi:MerR family transcriptional regulator [Spirochaetia bacterium]|nr:MerR family transcriptional regulator [Spirochaetia bacterium]
MTIAEAGEQYGLSTDTLRYYERIGLIPPVTRNKGGSRDYGEKDCMWVQFAKCMRQAGIPVEALIEYVNLFQCGEETKESRRTILKEQRELLIVRMAELQRTLDLLNYKIEHYDNLDGEAVKKFRGEIL